MPEKQSATNIELDLQRVAERLLAIAAPDSNEQILISQIEASKNDPYRLRLQAYLYAQLGKLAETNRIMAEVSSNQYWLRTISKRYLRPVIAFYDSMERYWDELVSSPVEFYNDEFLSATLIEEVVENAPSSDYAAFFAAIHLGVRPVTQLPMNPFFLARELGANAGNKEENMGHSIIRSRAAKWQEQLAGVRNLEAILQESAVPNQEIYAQPLSYLSTCLQVMLDNVYAYKEDIDRL